MTLRPDALRGFGRLFLSVMALAGLAAGRGAEPAAPSPRAAEAPGTYREKVELVTDASVADSLARQKNLNFDTVRIDGEASGMSLSALSADQILEAEAMKVPTPDLDADAVGGFLQLTSRPAFEQKGRTLQGSLSVTHDPRADRPGVDGAITFGRSLGSAQRAGFIATLEHRRRDDGDEQVELNWRPGRRELDKFQFGRSREHSREVNFNGSMDWKLGAAGMAFVRTEAQFARESDQERELTVELPAGMADGAVAEGLLRRSLQEGRRRQRELMIAAGAKHHGPAWLLDLRLSHRAQADDQPDQRSYEFAQPDAPIVFEHRDPRFPVARNATRPGLGTPGLSRLEELQVHDEEDQVTDSVASFDVLRRWSRPQGPAWIKSGLKTRFGRTTRDERHEIHVPRAAGITAAEFSAAGATPVLAGRYRLDGYPEFGALRRLFDTRPDRLELDADKTRGDTDPANYDVRQDVVAAYAMGGMVLAGNRVVAGVRAERTQSRFQGYEVAFDETGRYAGTTPTGASRAETDVFPGLHVSRRLPGGVAVYVSWTKSIRRPEYTDLVPARRISRADREIDEGNADLRSTLYTNYDVSVDYSYPRRGKLTLELFHRDISDPTLVRRTLLTDGPFAGFERGRPENGASAQLQGGELGWEQELAALHSRLEGFEVEFNYRHEHSRQVVELRPGEPLPLTNRPRHVAAVQLAYERGPYYVALEYEHASRRLDSIGRHRSEDRIEPPTHTWDASLSREFGSGFRLILDIDNLRAAPDRRYTGDPSRPDRYGLDVRTYRLGLKWEG